MDYEPRNTGPDGGTDRPGYGVLTDGAALALHRRLGRMLNLYLFPLIVFGLVAYNGGWALSTGGNAFGVPWAVAGSGGILGTAGIMAAAAHLRGGLICDDLPPSRLRRATTWARASRLFMVAVAVTVAAFGVLLAPTGMDHGFAITVNVGLAIALALFALFASDVGVKSADVAGFAGERREGPGGAPAAQ